MGNTLTLAVCACACGCVLTHGPLGEAHVCAPPVQADVGSSQRGSASGGPSSAFESHKRSSLQGGGQRRGSGPDQSRDTQTMRRKRRKIDGGERT